MYKKGGVIKWRREDKPGLRSLGNSERRCRAQQRTPQKDGPEEYE